MMHPVALNRHVRIFRQVLGLALVACAPATGSLAVTPGAVAPTSNVIIRQCAGLSPSDSVSYLETLPYRTVNPFRRCWYTNVLQALHESALQVPEGSSAVSYRFLYIPSFRPAISIRLERHQRIEMIVSQTTGWGGYDPRSLMWSRTFPVGEPAWDSLQVLLATANVWADTIPESSFGLDGSQWLLEGRRAQHRVFVEHWSPEVGGPLEAYRLVGTYLFDLAGIPADARD